MHQPKFEATISDYRVISEIDGAWNADDFRELLEAMDFPVDAGTSDGDLRELCVMSLADRTPEEAAEILLSYRLSEKMNAGQIQNASQEFAGEKMWEQYADISAHEFLFHVGSLLYAAFETEFFTPEAAQIDVEIRAGNPAAEDILTEPMHESFLVRLLADGMTENSAMRRLFDDQINGETFGEADSIVWIVTSIDSESDNPKRRQVRITGSSRWLDALKHVDSFESTAIPDADETHDG